ncbi:unnamed protein product, partial [marine sediment metagenome]
QSGLIYFNNVDNTNTHYPYTNGDIYVSILRESDRFQLADGGFDKTVWHHIVITSKPGANNWIMYRNGNSIGDMTGNDTLEISISPTIGKSEGNYFLNGTIDEVMIFNTSLTATQILELYNNQSARFIE